MKKIESVIYLKDAIENTGMKSRNESPFFYPMKVYGESDEDLGYAFLTEHEYKKMHRRSTKNPEDVGQIYFEEIESSRMKVIIWGVIGFALGVGLMILL